MKLISGLAAVALAATTLAPLVPAWAATPAQAADAAGDWLAGEVPVALAAGEFDFYPGQLIDAGLALQGTDHTEEAGDVADDLAPLLVSTEEYDYGYAKATEFDWETHANLGVAKYANATAKAAAFTERIGRDASTEYADIDLIAQLEELTDDATGRMADVSSFGNFANTIGQAFAVEALAAVDSAETAGATEALLAQQCPAGFFPLDVDKTCPASETSPDVTALVVTSLVESGLTTPEVTTAIADGADWLESLQLADGSFPGGAAGSNTNGTGLAGWALGAAGRTQSAAKAGAWVRGLQVSDAGACATLAPTGAIAYNAADLATGRATGIASQRATWRIAASQAAPALTWAPAASSPLGISTPSTASDAVTVTATVTGLAAGEYGCVTLGTTARSIKGTGGAVTTDFQLPAGSGSYAFTVTTLTGSQTSTTTVPAPASPAPTPTATPTTPVVEPVVGHLRTAKVERVRHHRFRLAVACRGPEVCAGSLVVRTKRVNEGTDSARARRLVVARATYTVEPGEKSAVVLKVRRAVRAQLRDGRVRVVAQQSTQGADDVRTAFWLKRA